MPELPEVEISCRGIKPHLVGAKIIYTIIRNSNLRWPISDEIYRLNENLVLNVKRRAKYLLLELLNGWVIIHLGMSGSLRILSEEIPVRKHDHFDLIMNNKKVLRYTDPRRFGAILWAKKLEEHRMFVNLGPEPLSKIFNGYYLQQKCVKKNIPIKICLMNNKLVVGIGNIYANESLFIAKIHPDRLASSLSVHECVILAEAIKTILKKSIEKGGTTLKDFTKTDGKPGCFAQELKVYNRKDKPCLVCKTPIMSSKHANRATFYCLQCQK